MYGVVEKAVVFVRYAFIFGIFVAVIFGLFKGKNILLYGYVQGAACVVALILSKIVTVVLREKVEIWVPGTWGDLTREDYEKIPMILKVVIAFQYFSLFYLSFVFGWFVLSIIYFWIK